MMDLFGKLQEAQKQMAEAKKKLDNVFVESEVEQGLVRIKATANNKIVNISISPELIKDGDVEAIEDLLLTAINRALEKAQKANEEEMKGLAKGMIPGL